MERQKRVLAVHDISGVGRCSLTVALPIISAAGVECSVLPTAVLSTHTGGFTGYTCRDLTDDLLPMARHWSSLGERFDAIYMGYLGSFAQMDMMREVLSILAEKDTLIAVDPVMGDYGKLYPTYDKHLAESMRGFLDVADILTPNLTEACFLADAPYRTDFTDAELAALCEKLAARHADRIVISGIPRGDTLVNFIYETGRGTSLCVEPRIGADRSGTGDVFSSVILGDAVNGVDFATSVCKASRFTAAAVRRSVELGIPEKDGLAIEEVLKELTA